MPRHLVGSHTPKTCSQVYFVLATLVAVALLVVSLGNVAAAADVQWKGAGTSGATAVDPLDPATHWVHSPNWNGSRVPDEADHAVLNFTGIGAVHSESLHVEDLTLQGSGGATLRLASGPFTVDDFFAIQGSAKVVQTGGVHSIGRELNISSTFGSTVAYRLEGGELHTGATAPWWEGEASIGRGGFVQTGGWHNVLSDMNVSSSLSDGGYQLVDGRLTVGSELRVYGSSQATMQQSGGIAEIDELRVATVNSTIGRYELLGGELKARQAEFGLGGSATIVQSGGNFTVSDRVLLAYFDHASAIYTMSAGSLTTKNYIVAREGSGNVTQGGGVVTVTEAMMFSQNSQANAYYELTAGELHVGQLLLGGAGVEKLTQRGGDASVDLFNLTDNAVYEYHGGTLSVGSGFHLRGTLNLLAPLNVDVGADTIVDLTGTIFNPSRLSLAIGPNSLTVLPSSLNPQTAFASYSNTGHVVVQGQSFVLQQGQTIRGSGEVFEHLVVNGTVEAPVGGALDLHAVQINDGAIVNLRGGHARLNRGGSTITGGTFQADRVTVTTTLVQSGGSTTVDKTFAVNGQYTITGGNLTAATVTSLGAVTYNGGAVTVQGSLQASAGRQELQSGSLTTKQTGLFGPTAVFAQTGGVHTTERVRTVSRATFSISGGQLVAGVIGVGEDAGGTVDISGAADVLALEAVDFGQGGMLAISGGRLRTRSIDLASFGPINTNALAWTGGRIETETIAGKEIVNNGGVLAPTSVGAPSPFAALHVTSAYTQTAGTLEIELGGLQPGIEYDQLAVSGVATLGGALDVRFAEGFQPRPGDRFDILTAASIVGDFASMALPPIAGGLDWIIDRRPTSLSLAVPAATDFNNDGVVNALDLSTWELAFGGHAGGDADADGDTDGRDFLHWQSDAGRGVAAAPHAAHAATPVPEPATAVLMLVLSTAVRSGRASERKSRRGTCGALTPR